MIDTKNFDGDVSVGRNAAIGGDAKIVGGVTVGRNLKVEGWLDAKNIKAANKGVFLNEESLKKAYPIPRDGWWALVGETMPAALWVAYGGEWSNTGGTGGEITVESQQMAETIARFEEEMQSIRDVNKLQTNNIVALQSKDISLDDKISALKAKDIEHNAAIVAIQGKDAAQDEKIAALQGNDAAQDNHISYCEKNIYKLNEDAGSLAFHGSYAGNATISTDRKTAAEDGHTYQVVKKGNDFYLKDIYPGGGTVMLHEEWDALGGVDSSESYARTDIMFCLPAAYSDDKMTHYYYKVVSESGFELRESAATYLLRRLYDAQAKEVKSLKADAETGVARNLSLTDNKTLRLLNGQGGKIGAAATLQDKSNLYEGSAGATTVPLVMAKALGGIVEATLGAATSARAGVMTVDHVNKISKLEERVLQYLYPKIYQLNEGAGARVFNGFTEYEGVGSLINPKDTYRYSVLYSTTQKQFVLNVTDEAGGVGVRVGTFTFWPEISLPNGSNIASSESYAQRDCLYSIFVDGEGSTYYYIDSNGVASEQSATYLLRLLANKNASDIAALQGKDSAQDVEIATLHERDKALDGKISALEAKDIEQDSAIVRGATVEYYDHSVTDGPDRINTRANIKFLDANNNQLFNAVLLGAGNGYPGLLSLKYKTKIDGYADTFSQNPVASSESNGLMSAEDKSKLDSVDEVIDIPWNDDVNGQDGYINNFTERGEYHIHGERLYDNDGLPILNAASGHTIDGLMTVLDSSLPNGNKYDVCVTQILRLNNRVGGDGHIYVRTGIAAAKSELQRPTAGGWSPWEKLMGVFEKNAVSNATELNEYTSSGMYDGMFVFSPESQTTVSGLRIENGSTFLMIAVNGYAVAKTGVVPQVTQLLYVMPSGGLDGSSVINAKLYTRTGIYVASTKTYTWGKFDGLAYASDISKLNGYIQENSGLIQENQVAISTNTKEIARVNSTATQAQEDAGRAQEAANTAQNAATAASTAAQEAKNAAETAQTTAAAASAAAAAAKQTAENEATARTEADTELQSQINGKQDNIGSFSADEKAALLVSLGLGKIGIVSQKQTWNAVGVEPAYVMSEKVEGFISKDNIDSLISYGFAFNEGTGYFELNGLTDISLQEALNIVAAGKPNLSLCDLHYAYKNIRTNLPILDNNAYNVGYFGEGFGNLIRICAMAFNSNIEVFVYGQVQDYVSTGFVHSMVSGCCSEFRDCTKLEKIYIIPGTTTRFYRSFERCIRLKELELVYLKCDVNLGQSSYLSAKSTHIMIANAKNSDAITITLHADAKARWEASEYYEEDSQTIISKNITIA